MRLCFRAALLTVLLGSVAVRADDLCLSGTSTLADQRAVVALRTNLETSCPCASAVSRGAYRRCARGALNAVIAGSELRAACETTGKLLIKGAACGSSRVPCGRVQPTAKVPVSCKPRNVAACTDRSRFDQTACTSLDFCADAVDWTAGTCSDVRAPGPFAAGVQVLTFTKPSAVNPAVERVLETVVWYPTAPGAEPIDGFYGGVLDGPIDASGGPYPVVMFSHGSCGYAAQSRFLLPLLATRGFVVVSPPHPGNTLFDGFPACSAAAVLVQSAVERPQDIVFALDQMLALDGNVASPFFGVLDAGRIGMMGHSFGGFTTYRVVTQDARFRVAVPLAPAAQNAPPMPVPSLSMISTLDSFVNNDVVRAAFAAGVAPKYLVELENTGHFAYSDGCFPGPDCNPPVTLTQSEAHAEVLRWVVPFLEWRLKGDDTFGAFFDAPALPGVIVAAE